MQPEPLFGFVLMPFRKEFSDVFNLGIKEPAEKLGIRVERVDQQIYAENMMERIYNQISAADFIIADMSTQNPNVFYEVGYAHAKEKICILITKDSSDIPFDLRQRRHIVYGDSLSLLKQEMTSNLELAAKESSNINKSHVSISLKTDYSTLDATKTTAAADMHFVFELFNESSVASPEIEQMFFYSGDGWSLAQDGRDCAKTASDRRDYKVRHLIASPVRKLQPGGWLASEDVVEIQRTTAV